MSVRSLCAVVAKTYAAARRTPRPARQTGRRRAVSRRGVTACALTMRLLPGELVGERLPRELSQQCRKQHEDGDESDQLGLPLQHPQNLPEDARLRDSLAVGPGGESPGRGIRGIAAYEAEKRPASASGRRPHANCCSYQPLSGAIATPKPDEWMNQPLPR